MIRLEKQPGESQAEFCERCHRELEAQIPETDRRNTVCLQMCRDQGFDQTVQRFSENEFHTVHDVPVFAEHTTKDRDGNLVVYDRNALAAIVERCNERIADTGNFPPITEGHTPTKDEVAQGAKMPPVLGYAANFRLGMIGNKNPRWAVFCDEYQHREDVPKLRKLLRRSPEVWLEERMEDRFFDPIAALGAETPRLDMGMARFGRQWTSQAEGGRLVEKYTAVAPAAANTFVPGMGDDEPDRHNAEGVAMLGPEDVNQIVEAIMQTEPMQWVQAQMTGEVGEPDPGMDPGMGGDPMGGGMPPAAPAPPVAGPPAGPPAGPEAPPAAPEKPPYEPDEEDRETFSRYMAGDMDEEEFQQYAAGKRQSYAADCPPDDNEPGEPEMYNRRHAERIEKAKYAKLESKVKELEQKAAKAEAASRQAERYSKLSDLHREGYSFDVNKEAERTAGLTDEQFDAHLDCITENYSRIPLEGAVPKLWTPELRHAAEDNDKKAKYSKIARDRVLAERAKGNNSLTYEQALEEAKAEAVA